MELLNKYTITKMLNPRDPFGSVWGDQRCLACLNSIESGMDLYKIDWTDPDNHRPNFGMGYACSEACANMYILQNIDNPPTNRLRAKWSVDVANQLRAVHGMEIEKELLQAIEEFKNGDIV